MSNNNFSKNVFKGAKYKKKGFTIEINLHKDGYYIEANVMKVGDKESKDYEVDLRLGRDDIDKLDKLGKLYTENNPISSDNVNMDVCNEILKKFKEGYFDDNFKRFEYDLRCFDTGNEYYEAYGDDVDKEVS